MINEELDKHTFQKALDSLPFGIFILAPDQSICYWNKWLTDKTTMPSQQVIGKKILDIFPDADLSRFNSALEQVLLFDSPQILSQTLNRHVFPIRLIDSSYESIGYMQQRVEVHPLTQKETRLALVIVQDVTAMYVDKMDLLSLARQFSQTSDVDAMTGAYNRRYMWNWLEHAINRAKDQGLDIACCLFDIDNFKTINDKKGHDIGDKAILTFVDTVKSTIRQNDILVRYGGDEFITFSIYKGSNHRRGGLAERIVKELRSISFEGVGLTVSSGVSIWSEENPVSAKELIEQADKALYEAKQAGRDCFKYYTD